MLASPSFPRLLLTGIAQGLFLGGLGGLVLGKWLFRSDEFTDLVSTWQTNRNCPSCASGSKNETADALAHCPAPPPAMSPQCVSLSSETFMSTSPDVEEFYNKRMLPVPGVLNADECRWIIEAAGAEKHPANTAMVIPRKSKSWAWVYERIHSEIAELNKQFWHVGMPSSIHSELIENILLVVRTNESAVFPGYTYDLSSVGSAGKRVLSAFMILNSDFEGGQISTLPDQQDTVFDLPVDQGVLWIMRSFTLKKHLPITSGRQYMLFYWLRRY